MELLLKLLGNLEDGDISEEQCDYLYRKYIRMEKERMVDFRIEKLANNLLTYSVNIQKGDNILIEVLGEDGINLAKELIKSRRTRCQAIF